MSVVRIPSSGVEGVDGTPVVGDVEGVNGTPVGGDVEGVNGTPGVGKDISPATSRSGPSRNAGERTNGRSLST